MTYRHLISRRNAALRRGVIAGAVLLAACGDGLSFPSDPTQDHPEAAFSELVAMPDNPVLAPAQSTALRATALAAGGAREALAAEWDLLDGGRIRETLLDSQPVAIFSASEPGTYRIGVTTAGGALHDTVVVVVPSAAQTGSITGLALSPRQVDAGPGDTIRFAVQGFGASGDTIPAATTLAADAGTVRGLSFVAGNAGKVRVVASLSGGSLQDTAWVTVEASGSDSTPASAPSPTPATPAAPAAPATPAPTTPAPAPAAPSGIAPGSPAELPRVLLDTRYRAPTGRTIRVPAGGNLQAALNGAARGDVVELAAGVTYTGNFTLPAKPGTGWITIRTGTTLPAEGTRVTPSSAASARFAKLSTPNSMPALETTGSPQSSYYRVMGMEIASSYTGLTFALVFLGDSKNQTTSSGNLSTDIILDRVYVHGGTTQSVQRCIALNNRRGAIVDSYVTECHIKGGDSQAIIGWNGPGPYKIANNYLAGAGENIMFGGGDPKISGLVPSDIEIRGNHITKPLAWKSSNRWSVKNLYESKNSQRVLLENNIFENNWADAQTGMGIVLKSENQSGRCTWCTTADYTFRYNKVINSPGGFSITGSQVTVNGGASVPARRISIAHTVFESVALNGQAGAKRLFQIGPRLTDLVVAHNTGFPEGMMFFLTGAAGSTTHFVMRDNLFARGSTGLFGDSRSEGLPSIAAYAPSATVAGNVLVGARAATYPAGNWLPASTTLVRMVAFGARDYSLLSSSPFYNKGSDGRSPGADLAALNSRLAPVR